MCIVHAASHELAAQLKSRAVGTRRAIDANLRGGGDYFTVYISTITIGEIRRGIEGLPAGKRKAGLQSWLTGLCHRMEGRILSFNTSVAHVWGQITARCDKGCITLPTADSQIAATAHRHGLTVH